MADTKTCCTVANPRARNVQQIPRDNAQDHATNVQQTGLKALAHKVMARNGGCNERATEGCETVQQTPSESGVIVAPNVAPLAARLRALGCPIALEVDGEPVCWLVADKEAEMRAEVRPCFTADEAAVLAQFDAKGMHDLIEIKRVFGGTLKQSLSK